MAIKIKFQIFKYHDWRFLQLALFLVVLMFVSPYINDAWIIRAVTSLVLLNSIYVVFSTEENLGHHKGTILVLWGCSVVVSLVSPFFGTQGEQMIIDVLETLLNVLILVVLILDILIYVFNKNDLTVDSIFASMSVYLMIALLFASIYTLMFNLQPDSFRVPLENNVVLAGAGVKSNMFYFSIVTIATLGYGDIVPVTHVARMVAGVEAVIGQFFVAVVVALLVGKIIINMGNKET